MSTRTKSPESTKAKGKNAPGTPIDKNPVQKEKVDIHENGEPVTKQGDTSQSETPKTSTANPGENKIKNSTGEENSKGIEPGLPAEIHKRAKEVFSEHKTDVIYCTSDGTMFLHPQFARMHARGLKDNSFITIKRQEV